MHKFVCLLFIVAIVMLHLKQLRGDIFNCKPSSNTNNDNVKQKFNSSDVLTLNIISTWWHKPTHFQLTCSSSNAICNSNTCKRHYKWNYQRRFGDCTYMARHIFMATRLLYHEKQKINKTVLIILSLLKCFVALSNLWNLFRLDLCKLFSVVHSLSLPPSLSNSVSYYPTLSTCYSAYAATKNTLHNCRQLDS